MNKQVLRTALIWGFILWFIGYVLGIVFFPFVPTLLLGWAIMPIGIVITLWVLIKRIKLQSFQQYVILAVIWVFIAVICDYFLLVKLIKPVDGYYKLDVFIYYILIFTLPLVIGWKKIAKKQ